MSQPHSHSLKPDGHKAKTPVQMARSAAWQICIEELKAWRVRRAARMLLILTISYIGAPGVLILKRISYLFAGGIILKPTPKVLSGSPKSMSPSGRRYF